MFLRSKFDLRAELNLIKESGLYKDERIILSDQKANILVSYPAGAEAKEVLNFCSNNYLGLANHPYIIESAIKTIEKYGFGLASVRFICGTQDIHKILEEKISCFYQTDDTILYSSCYDANTGLFESILGKDDVIITDSLNHASIINGIRLCKARRLIYEHSDMNSLEHQLQLAREGRDIWEHTGLAHEPVPAKNILIVTDGVFSMDGDIAKLREIIDLANVYDAMVMVYEFTMLWLWLMILTLRVSLALPAGVVLNIAMCLVKWILLLQRLVKLWGALPVVLLPVREK